MKTAILYWFLRLGIGQTTPFFENDIITNVNTRTIEAGVNYDFNNTWSLGQGLEFKSYRHPKQAAGSVGTNTYLTYHLSPFYVRIGGGMQRTGLNVGSYWEDYKWTALAGVGLEKKIGKARVSIGVNLYHNSHSLLYSTRNPSFNTQNLELTIERKL